MGIKTQLFNFIFQSLYPLKNLPTTWGLRRFREVTKEMACL